MQSNWKGLLMSVGQSSDIFSMVFFFSSLFDLFLFVSFLVSFLIKIIIMNLVCVRCLNIKIENNFLIDNSYELAPKWAQSHSIITTKTNICLNNSTVKWDRKNLGFHSKVMINLEKIIRLKSENGLKFPLTPRLFSPKSILFIVNEIFDKCRLSIHCETSKAKNLYRSQLIAWLPIIII